MPENQTLKVLAHRRSLSVALSISILAAVAGAQACDFDVNQRFRIGSGTLSESLLTIGRYSGCTIVFKPGNTYRQNIRPINGWMSVREAMNQALADADLETIQTRNGTVTVRKKMTADSQRVAQ